MKLKFLGALCACALATTALNAATVLTFEGLGDQEAVLNYYNGGKGGNGSGPGANYGVSFGADSLAIISNTAGGSGNFDGNPSGNTILFFLNGPGDVMNVSAGFTKGFSFFYSSPFNTGSVQVYSGLNGTGTLLANLSLPTTPQGEGTGSCNSFDAYCPWVPFGVSFSGTAMSAVFTGTANHIGFDDITLGSSKPGNAPEPASILMLGSGVAALGLLRLRKRKA
jgi:hypothetical protein